MPSTEEVSLFNDCISWSLADITSYTTIPSQQNLYEIGQHVVAPSEEEINKAISQIRGVL